jgi:hypothetical protein
MSTHQPFPGNPHARHANELNTEPFVQAQAVLTLAFEQRTANLLAWLQLQVSVPDLAMDDPAVVEIQKRLGL